MKVGIIGSEGVVGSALKFGFELLGNEVKCHDVKLDTKLQDILDTEVVFVCVPSPKNEDGSCNTSIVEEVIEQLYQEYGKRILPYQGWLPEFPIVCIKSTVPIGTTEQLLTKYFWQGKQVKNKSNFHLCHSPEFLRERSAIIDFTERQELLVIGTNNDKVFDVVKKAHGKLPKKVVKVSPSESESIKYFNNAFGAMLVVFANSFYEVCKKHDVKYANVKNVLAGTMPHIPDVYLEVNDKWRSYAGVCWSKDLPALNKMAETTGVEFFRHIIEENEKYKKTVPPGMREK